jgi:hypothetical protein
MAKTIDHGRTPKMSIDLTERTICIWYVEMPKQQANYLGALERLDDDYLQYTFRFRYKRDKKIFDSEDEKNWYSFKTKCARGEEHSAITKIRMVTRLIADKEGGEFYELLRGAGTLEQFFSQFAALPFVHGKLEKITENNAK